MTFASPSSIHQILVSASPRDAVTDSALQLQRILRRAGSSDIFSCNIHPEIANSVFPIDAYSHLASQNDSAITIVHVSMGDPRFLPFLKSVHGSFIVIYHNMTPPHFFESWDPVIASHLRGGRDILPALRDRTVLALAASEFSARDLTDLGYRNVKVAGLILDEERLLEVPADPRASEAARRLPGPIVLSVGQLYPHKRLDLMLAAFYRIVERIPTAHLVIAGACRLTTYHGCLARYCDQLGLRHKVTITGEIAQNELVAWYRNAAVFVTVSEHEGFCVPLVEAMTFGVPIVARDNAAIPETSGGACLLAPRSAGPTPIAEAVCRVISDLALRDRLRRLGNERRHYFSFRENERRFLDSIGGLI